MPGFHKENGGTFRGWLYTITRHKITDLHRRQQLEPAGTGGSDAQRWIQAAAPDDELSSVEKTSQLLLLQQTLERIRGEFTASTWQAFWRTSVEGEPTADVGRELNLSPGAVPDPPSTARRIA